MPRISRTEVCSQLVVNEARTLAHDIVKELDAPTGRLVERLFGGGFVPAEGQDLAGGSEQQCVG